MVIFEALFRCHDILILVKCPIKWIQRPDMIIAVDWDANHKSDKQRTKKLYLQLSKKVKVGNDQGLTKLERTSHSKDKLGKTTLTIKCIY